MRNCTRNVISEFMYCCDVSNDVVIVVGVIVYLDENVRIFTSQHFIVWGDFVHLTFACFTEWNHRDFDSIPNS